VNKYYKISIITPVLNQVNNIESTILSVLSQEYPNLEYIIIDGGSTDGTIKIIKKYEHKLAYWISEKDDGMYHAIQKGINKSTGDIIAWINSDDMYHSKSFFTVSQIFNDLPSIEWIIGTPTLYNTDGNCVKVFPISRWSKNKIITGDYKWIQQESIFFRREVWIRNGSYFNTSFKYAADCELWFRFISNTTLYSVNTILSGFRVHKFQLSDIYSTTYLEEVNQIFKKYRILWKKKPYFHIIFKIKEHLLRSKIRRVRILGSLISLFLNHLYLLPPIIYYDFSKSKWRI
jgi:glycosyltransferase involved in cell wall biosynthesis